MIEGPGREVELRGAPRVALPAMYTLIRVREGGDEHFSEVGHIYDVSETGIRFELDREIPAGTEVEIRALLPGPEHTTIRAVGRIVRRHDEAGERGPIRMGMIFDRFVPESDHDLLVSYMRRYELRKAA